ncbi:hypothetical protein Ddc_14919 [Ditylenchus destructor]|nr:hypothetical protein Ddc_14919 [Ditylenchus destructor]
MSRDSFLLNFNLNNFSNAAQDFPKSNVVELEGSKWYLGIEKTQSCDYNCKILNVFLTCERETVNGTFKVNLALILRGSFIDLLFTTTYCFEPMDLEMACFKIDCSYIFDKDNGFINEDDGCEIMAEISVRRRDSEEGVEDVFKELKVTCLPPKELHGMINLQAGHRVPVNKELLSSHSEYFNNIFYNPHFEESSQESIDLTAFTYKQFRLLHKHICQRGHLYKDGTVEFRLKFEGGVSEFKRLMNLTDIQEYYWQQKHTRRAIVREQSDYGLFNQTLNLFDDVEQIRAILGLFCCVSTEYDSMEHRTVSSENVDDLLCVGSYFQISKILDRCKEFLRLNYPDLSGQRRKALVEKYNLSLDTAIPMDYDFLKDKRSAQSDRSSTEMLVYVNFLDTGNEEMCIIKYENGMPTQTLYSFALIQLYSIGNCNRPSEYELERIRISDPNALSIDNCQSVVVEDNTTFKFSYVRPGRIYSFEVRQIPTLPISEAIQPTLSQFSAKVPRMNDYCIDYQDRISNEIPTRVNFLDTGLEETCSIQYEDAMSIEILYSYALLHLYYRGKCNPPSRYQLERIRISDPNTLSTNDIQSEGVKESAILSFNCVRTSCTYCFDVRQITTGASTHSASKTIPFSLDAYRRKVREDEEEIEPKASSSGQSQTISEKCVTASQLHDIRRSTFATPNIILIHVTFSDNQEDEICQVPYEDELKILDMVQRMFLLLHTENHTVERDYEVSNVRMFYPEFCAEPINLEMQELVRSENDSVIYQVHLKRKEV